jgi:protein-S-isoprenylcysteine O-methyltransferase Ste14
MSPSPLRWLMRVPVPWVFVLAYFLGCAVERLRPSDLRAGLAAGIVVFSLGAALAGWGLATFHKARTTTVPGLASEHLVTWGPYRFSRNPMYVGLSLAYVGEAFLLRQAWPLALLPLVVAYVNWVVIPVEEAKLTEVFGSEYEAYRARTRRWL